MALSRERANRILQKAGVGITIRQANHAERLHGFVWVHDRAEFQALQGFRTLDLAIGTALEEGWATFDGSALTAKELAALRAIPSNVARLIGS